jgi:hypothetical protein
VKQALKGRVLPVAIGAAVVVTGANIASYAANGHPFDLGGYNRESAPTTVTNDGGGPAFRFKTGDGVAPFTVSSDARVTRLNASRLGGLRAGQLSRSYRYVLPANTRLPSAFVPNNLPPGQYDVTFSVLTNSDPLTSQDACWVADSRHANAVLAGGMAFTGTALFSGAGAITVDSTGDAALVCNADAVVVQPGDNSFRSTLVFTRVQTVRTGPLQVGPAKTARRDEKEWAGR